jgi:hypothetical protein
MLIFQNGTALFGEPNSQSDIDESGKAVSAAEPTLSVPCFIEPTGEDRKGRNDDGAFPHGSYTILLDYDSIDEATFKPSMVWLQHERKGDLGKFTVQRYELYDITRTIKVWV